MNMFTGCFCGNLIKTDQLLLFLNIFSKEFQTIFLCLIFRREMPSCQYYFLITLWVFGFIVFMGYYISIPKQQWVGQNTIEGLIQNKEIEKDQIKINFSNYSLVKELMR